MRIKYVHGSFLDAPERYIVHGCNAQGRMGSGAAKVLMDRYARVRPTYIAEYERHKREEIPFLGTAHYVINEPDEHIVINAITQENCGDDGALYVSYDAIAEVFEQINNAATAITGYVPSMPVMDAVAMPLIGCGLAGGDWKIVSEIIENLSTSFEPVVYLIDGKIPS